MTSNVLLRSLGMYRHTGSGECPFGDMPSLGVRIWPERCWITDGGWWFVGTVRSCYKQSAYRQCRLINNDFLNFVEFVWALSNFLLLANCLAFYRSLLGLFIGRYVRLGYKYARLGYPERNNSFLTLILELLFLVRLIT